MTSIQTWKSRPGPDTIRIRKHKVPALRMPGHGSAEGPYYGESQVFGGQSIEEIVAAHPLIRGHYHVEVAGDDGRGSLNYVNGGDLTVLSKTDFTYTPHAEAPVIVDCVIVQQRLLFRERHKHAGSPKLDRDWVRSPASLLVDGDRLNQHWLAVRRK